MSGDARDTGRFDRIGGGAGSAGSVPAARFFERTGDRGPVPGAGGRGRNPFIHVPADGTKTFNSNVMTWRFEIDPADRTRNRTMPRPRGKVANGCSSSNGTPHARGNGRDFDNRTQMGNRG